MKKRLISLLVALCMAVTLLPVSALTAWAEESSQLKIVGGYPVGSGENHDRNCSGDGWSYDGSTQTLTLDPSTPTTYDLKESGKHPSGSKQYFMFCHHREKRNDCKW